MVRTDIAPMLIPTDTKNLRLFGFLKLGLRFLSLSILVYFGFLGLFLLLLLLRMRTDFWNYG